MRTEVDTRGNILAAAERVIRERGLAGATTKAIAEAAGCAEGSLYRYFPDKHALFHELVHTRFPGLIALLAELPDRAGTATVRKNLEEVATVAIAFYREILPMTAGVMSEQHLLEEQRRYFKEKEHGPMRAIGSLSDYIRKEQRLGRISDRVPADCVARLLLGSAFQHAFMLAFLGEDYEAAGSERLVKDTIRTLAEGLKPRKEVTV